MVRIEYDAQVSVQSLRFDPQEKLWHGYVKWDGIALAEAVRRIQALPLNEQLGATISAPGGVLGIESIHEIYERSDFPAI